MANAVKNPGKTNRAIRSVEYMLRDGSAHGVQVLYKASGAIHWFSRRDDQRKYFPVLNAQDLKALFANHVTTYRTVMLTTGEVVEYMPGLKGHTIVSGEELGFSWTACEDCGSKLGGDRFAADYYNVNTGEKQPIQICADCLYSR